MFFDDSIIGFFEQFLKDGYDFQVQEIVPGEYEEKSGDVGKELGLE
eukprot:CAMPEP_0202966658 /NCGR_PEP_ID=MMETSP1396-20130829/11201_1 /ASSEMBLY_ACC=CAM_ASM_000872 /TAXON_ID= /ORGANISM="Pseudokeronopsis sp., Strain Brazil" /LENGTH=45 /DNA_ID= /DNA_START= /DNA_END= /DNA_ORIENTATION=